MSGPGTGGAGVIDTSQTLTTTDTTDALVTGAGTLFANATILGGLNTPLLRASASSNSQTYASIQAVGAQGYTVISGGSNQTINFTVSLTGTVTNPGGDATGLAATVGVVKVTDVGDFLLEQTSLLAFFDRNAVRLEQTTDGAVNLSGNASILVNEGDQFYLWALLGASAGGIGASAISTSTLHAQFDPLDAANLNAVAVPLPASAFLLTSALPFLRIRRRR